ncbi:peptide-N-glycosidase F-related protein [Solitalea koreensis]|uniref:Peptide-N-glycosidase F, C terminal n=1 Tax=Solitalea koreensis TaxID=543615 RepID=A0A521BIG6_9SPHI|nr:peptide-N-glycosidase F-related protein [Solitalea koreensis]SMO46928.1 Peptide-N-glycosidase F, C terminal [Solitalea koreensis]
MKISRIVALIALFFCTESRLIAKTNDTLHVVTHNKTTIVTDPTQGFKLYKKWGVFPSADLPIRKITMHVKFACPDSMRCADWDYCDRISIARKGGVKGATQDYEIGRMLTPYGGAFGKDWKFNWEVDVTDFSLLLRDSVEVVYNHTGYEPNTDRGWAITIDFEIIKGKPALEPISIQKIYDGNFSYGDSTKSIEEALKPTSFTANTNTTLARLRIVQTGHGMDDPDGCGEFCSKYREIWYDGKLIDSRPIWKKCGDNPLYPQAGTWVIDRANWCPGTLMQPDLFDLNVQSGTMHTIHTKMQNYVSSKPSANETISAYLIQYKKTSAQNDIAIEDIIAPSSKSIYKRQNPAAANPQIILKNVGNNEINSLLIHYGTLGFEKKQFQWRGKLASGKKATILLPSIIDAKPGGNQFHVEIPKVNGKIDKFTQDNSLNVSFYSAPVLSNTLVFYLLTNNQPEQNAYVLKNKEGKIIQERKLGTLKANTTYRDTLNLASGAYSLELIDTAGNGLEFWYNGKGGRGSARLMNANGEMVKAFESDCGLGWVYNFKVGPKPDKVNPEQYSISLYPTRTKDKTTLDYFANKTQDVSVQIVTDPDARVVEEHKYGQLKEGIFTYDLSRFPKGRFYLKVLINGQEKFNKRIRLKE